MFWFIVTWYVTPTVFIWLVFLRDKLRGCEETKGGEAKIISTIYNIGSFVPLVNILISVQLVLILWKRIKEEYFREELE